MLHQKVTGKIPTLESLGLHTASMHKDLRCQTIDKVRIGGIGVSGALSMTVTP
jgi:hypothetical protein